MSEMNICLISYEFPPMVGGEGSYTYGLFKTLSELGYDVKVITTNFGIDEKFGIEEENVIRVPTINKPPLRLFSFAKNSKKALASLNFDIIHYTNDYEFVISKNVDVPTILTTHTPYLAEKAFLMGELKFAEYLHYLSYRRPDFIKKRLRILCGATDRIISVSNYVAKDIVNEYKTPQNKIMVIPNAVDITKFNPNIRDEEIRKKQLGIHDERVILFVGRMDHIKGVSYLINAFSMLFRERQDVKLVLVGGGPLQKRFESYVRKTHLRNSVIFTKGLREEELAQLYRTCHIFVLPSLIEGFGIVLLEAMATGKPCIASMSGGPEEIIKHGETGFLVPPADSKALFEKLFILLEDEELLKKFGDAGRKRVEKMFTWEKVAKQTVELYGRCRNV